MHHNKQNANISTYIVTLSLIQNHLGSIKKLRNSLHFRSFVWGTLQHIKICFLFQHLHTDKKTIIQ